MRSCILCIHIETSSLWAEFVNKNRCISVRLVSEEVKSIKFDNFHNSHNSFLWPEYFIDFLCERWIPWQAVTFVLCLHYRPEKVHCSTKDAYTSEITFLALHLCCTGIRDVCLRTFTIRTVKYRILILRDYNFLKNDGSNQTVYIISSNILNFNP